MSTLRLDFDDTPFGASLLEVPVKVSESTHPIHSAQQAITDPFGIDLPPLEGIAVPPSASILPVAASVHEQIARPFFGAAHAAIVITQDIAAAAQCSATSRHLQPSFESEGQPQNISSSISPKSEGNQPAAQKVSAKRKQPTASNSTKGKRKKTTSSKSVKAKPFSTEPAPFLRAIKAFQSLKKTKKGCIANALRNCEMRHSRTEITNLANHINAISDYVYYEETNKVTIPEKTFKGICAKRRVAQSRIAELLREVKPEDRIVYLEYHNNKEIKKTKRGKSTSSKSIKAKTHSTKSDLLLPAIRAFHKDTGKDGIPKVLVNNGLSDRPRFVELVRKYIYAIAERFLNENPDGIISDEALKKIYSSRHIKASRIEPLLGEARQNKQVYLDYFQKYQMKKQQLANTSQ